MLNNKLCEFISNAFYAIWSAEVIVSNRAAEDIVTLGFLFIEICVDQITNNRTCLVQIIAHVLNPTQDFLVALQSSRLHLEMLGYPDAFSIESEEFWLRNMQIAI